MKVKKLFAKLFSHKEKTNLSKFEKSNRRFKKIYPDYLIGRGSYGLPIVHQSAEKSTLEIGAFCSISHDVQIYLGGEHRDDWVTTSPLNIFFEDLGKYQHEKTKGDVIIGNDVWICGNATILSGVTIGHGAIIANGSLVTKDVEPYSIVAGTPAKTIRYRFDSNIVNELLNIAWWDWSEDILRQHIDKILSSDIQAFLEFAKTIPPNK